MRLGAAVCKEIFAHRPDSFATLKCGARPWRHIAAKHEAVPTL